MITTTLSCGIFMLCSISVVDSKQTFITGSEQSELNHRYLKKTPEPTTYAPSSSSAPSFAPSSPPMPLKKDSPASDSTVSPIGNPTLSPSLNPTSSPSLNPSSLPSLNPTISHAPSEHPSVSPTYTQAPSTSPTTVPSSTPSEQPTLTPSSSPSLSSQPSAAPIAYSRPTRVDIRYRKWSNLDNDIRTVATSLEYNASTWDNYGTHPLELLQWWGLTEDQMKHAATLGYDQKSWDCWQNHFDDYRWIDLGLEGIQVLQWFEDLGFDYAYWNGYGNTTPSSEGTMWYDLSSVERYAACQLCFIPRTWNGVDYVTKNNFPVEKPSFRFVEWTNLEDDVKEIAENSLKYSTLSWNVIGLNTIESRTWAQLTDAEIDAATKIGWSDSSWDCWVNHFKSYTWEDLVFYGVDFYYTALGWTKLSWEGVEDPPISHGMFWDLLDDYERGNATSLCYYRDIWDVVDLSPNEGPLPYPKPKMRYVPWNELSDEDRVRAQDSLFYDEESWNKYGVAKIEEKSWNELSELQQIEAMQLGFYEQSWDCFQNHYAQKEWNNTNYDTRDALSVLGWSEMSWIENKQPQSYSVTWEKLSISEREAAAILCYFDKNWVGGTDGTLLPSPSESSSNKQSTSAATGSSESSPTTKNSGQFLIYPSFIKELSFIFIITFGLLLS